MVRLTTINDHQADRLLIQIAMVIGISGDFNHYNYIVGKLSLYTSTQASSISAAKPQMG